jgi:UPF0755 protein
VSDTHENQEPELQAQAAGRSGRGFARFVSLLVFLVILLATLVAGGLVILHRAYSEPGPLAAKTRLVIPRGASGHDIGATLAEAGVAADARLFALAIRLFAANQPLRAGEYDFAPGVSLRDAVAKLQAGETVVRRLTVAEGLTTRAALAEIAEAPGLTGDVPGTDTVGEGTLLPETYHYNWGDSRADVVARMQADQRAALDRLWAARAPDLPLATPQEALVLASIVERETAVGAERPLVAGVFINRLNRGMRLQSDPTVAYGLVGPGEPLDRALTRTDLETDHPYNTYTRDGLPPGPIANPGLASIAAVLNPAETDALYFVADGEGGHAFARTLAEHNRNVARWRRIQRERRNNR